MAIMENSRNAPLPDDFGYEWTSMAFQEQSASGQADLIGVPAIVLVYLIPVFAVGAIPLPRIPKPEDRRLQRYDGHDSPDGLLCTVLPCCIHRTE